MVGMYDIAMFYDSVLEGSHGQLIQVLVSECDDSSDCDVTSMT